MTEQEQFVYNLLERVEKKLGDVEQALLILIQRHDDRISRLEKWLWVVPTSLAAAILILAVDILMKRG